ncbi:TIGR03808 family TAT-translocated repetitive protein [Pararhizobium gei]|uniref:TIGR03808 family TAT-translocated repetitive protein n=1 Tax=Pararhizobium gei TaxID=1395951 RepID=UPI0023DB6520|nr:TIGR03808 family TAT-translocated repetitive protein [Rhizobium gei]
MLKRRLLLFCLAATGFDALTQTGRASAASGATAGENGQGKMPSYGIVPNAGIDQSVALQELFNAAAAQRTPVSLAAGDYLVSGVTLPDNLVLHGVSGATRLFHQGGAGCLTGRGLQRLTLTDLILDGTQAKHGDATAGLLDLRDVQTLTLENCTLLGSFGHGLRAEQCGGRITGNSLSLCGGSGIYAVQSEGLSITGNTVSDCANGGILVHRWEAGEDGTIVSGNRISGIRARDGGTGENGNGINVFRAANVMVSGNHVSDCAFSAIRANSATNIQITGNQCLRSGETAIYSEFGFQGAIVSDNLIDGAANGILIVNFDEGGRLSTVSGNIVRNLHIEGPYIHDGAGFGFGIAAEADTVIIGNVIENAPKWGLMLGWGPYLRNIVATGNLVRNAGAGCAVTVVDGAGAALITDNLFHDVRDGAILGYRWNDRTTGDLLKGDAERFSHLTLSGNRRN